MHSTFDFPGDEEVQHGGQALHLQQLCPRHHQQLHQKLHLHLQVLRLGTHSPAAAGQDKVPGQGDTPTAAGQGEAKNEVSRLGTKSRS